MISVVIPCYKSEKTLENVVSETIDTLKQRKDKYEIILINDGSPDNVWQVILKMHEKNPRIVKGINFTKNFGQHSALLAGYKECKGDIVVSMDDDGQTDPKQIWKLIDKLNEGYDIVYAHYDENKESVFRKFGSWLNDKMSNILLNKPKDIKGTSYNAIKKYVVDEMIKYDKPYPYVAGLLYRTTQNVGTVDIEHKERAVGSSGYTLNKLIGLVMNGFTAFSIKPLRISSYIGSALAIIGFIYGITIIIKKIFNPGIQLGYSSIMSVILFIGGIIMLMLGLIGEYVGRIYISINNSPQYVIKEKTK